MKTFNYSFEKLEVWQKTRILVVYVYRVTGKLPDEEKFGLISQMRRSAVSVCSNIAEGVSRMSPKDQAHFTNQAFSSLMELLNQAIIATDLNLINQTILDEIRKPVQEIGYMLNSLHHYQTQKAITQNSKT